MPVSRDFSPARISASIHPADSRRSERYRRRSPAAEEVGCLLFNQFNNVTYSIRGVVAYQKMDMVFIGFHSYNAVAFGIADIVYLLFHIISNRAFKYLFAKLSYKDDMYFQVIFAPVVAIISVIH